MAAASSEEFLDAPLAMGDLLLGRYRAIELIAQGGQSLVWRVEDERLRRPACAKIFHGPDFEPSVRHMVERAFVEEAFLLSQLSDPAALQIYDFGFHTAASNTQSNALAVPVQIFEFVAGGPLSDCVKRLGPFAPAQVLGFVAPLVRVLGDLHTAGTVHLDVKPQNILFRQLHGELYPKLADFGIAQAIGAKPAADGGALMYSINWAAPEQLMGDRVGPGCDVYALALVVIFSLTGNRLYREPNPAQAYRLRRYADELIADHMFGFPAALLAVLQEACRFEPESRIADVRDFGRRLHAALEPLAGSPATVDATARPMLDIADVGRRVAAPMWALATDRPCPPVAGRRLQFLPLEPTADITSAPSNARLRLSLVALAPNRTALHIKGLNCFVASAGGRPSPAVTLERSAAVELYSPRGERLKRIEIAFAATGAKKGMVPLDEELLVIDPAPGPIVMLDFGQEDVCFLAHGQAMPN